MIPRLRPPTDATLNELNPFGQPDPAYTELGYLGHPGIDYRCPKGTPVYACDNGLVVAHSDWGTAGNTVIIYHNHGRTRYLHLAGFVVVDGAIVARGDLIGYSGGVPGEPGAGLTTGPHLHLDYYPKDEPVTNGYGGRVNPLDYMQEETVARTPEQQRIIDVLWVNANQRLYDMHRSVNGLYGQVPQTLALQTAIVEINGEVEKLKAMWPEQ